MMWCCLCTTSGLLCDVVRTKDKLLSGRKPESRSKELKDFFEFKIVHIWAGWMTTKYALLSYPMHFIVEGYYDKI